MTICRVKKNALATMIFQVLGKYLFKNGYWLSLALHLEY